MTAQVDRSPPLKNYLVPHRGASTQVVGRFVSPPGTRGRRAKPLRVAKFLRGARVVVPVVLPFRYPHMRFVETQDSSHSLQPSSLAPFSRALVGRNHQSLLGRGSRHCYGIITLTTRTAWFRR